jgi:hypothetical protein
LVFLYIRRSNIIVSLLSWSRTFWRRHSSSIFGGSIKNCTRLMIPNNDFIWINNAALTIDLKKKNPSKNIGSKLRHYLWMWMETWEELMSSLK